MFFPDKNYKYNKITFIFLSMNNYVSNINNVSNLYYKSKISRYFMSYISK